MNRHKDNRGTIYGFSQEGYDLFPDYEMDRDCED